MHNNLRIQAGQLSAAMIEARNTLLNTANGDNSKLFDMLAALIESLAEESFSMQPDQLVDELKNEIETW